MSPTETQKKTIFSDRDDCADMTKHIVEEARVNAGGKTLFLDQVLHIMGRHSLTPEEKKTAKRASNPCFIITAKRNSRNNEATVYTKDPNLFVCVKVVEDSQRRHCNWESYVTRWATHNRGVQKATIYDRKT